MENQNPPPDGPDAGIDPPPDALGSSEKQPSSTTLEKLRDYYAGTADEETHREISEALRDPGSDVSLFMRQVRETSRHLLGRVMPEEVEADARIEEAQDDLGPLEDMIRQIRARLRPGGPDVNYAALYAYLDEDLTEPERAEVERRIARWTAWHDAYWQLCAEMALLEASREPDEDPDPTTSVNSPFPEEQPVTLEELRDFLAGYASPEVRARVGAQIKDRGSELRRFLDAATAAIDALMGWEQRDEDHANS